MRLPSLPIAFGSCFVMYIPVLVDQPGLELEIRNNPMSAFGAAHGRRAGRAKVRSVSTQPTLHGLANWAGVFRL